MISPELALVSPELAEAARLQSPNRPWEVAVEHGCAPRVCRVDSEGQAPTPSVVPEARATPLTAGRALAPAQPDSPEIQARLQRERARVETRESRVFATEMTAAQLTPADRGVRRWRVALGLVLAVVVAGALAVGVPRLDVWKSGSEEGVLTAEPPVRTSPGERKVESPSILLPSAGYVVSPGGSFMTDASGRTIESFTLPLRCGSRPLVIEDIPVSRRSLRFTGKAVGGAMTVRLSGRVLDSERVRGTVAADGSACKPGRVNFFARLS